MKPVLLRGHEKPITAVKFNFDGDLLFTASGERKINVWYSMSGERVGSYEPLAAVRTLDVTNDSNYLVVGTNVGTLELFKVEGGQRIGFIDIKARFKTVQLSYGDKKLLALVEWYSRDEKSGFNELLVYDFAQLVQAYSASNGSDAVTLKPESVLLSKSKYCQVSWGLLNKTILAAREDGIVEIIDLNGTILKSNKVHQERINSFSISKEFAFMVTNSNEGSKLIDPEDLKVLKSFKTEVPMNSGCVSPLAFEGKGAKYHGIIAGGVAAREAAGLKLGGFEVRIVNLVHEEEIGRIAGHFGPVNTLAFYPDGRGFVSGGEEGIVRLFRFDEKYFKNFE